jgi:hypothetical protein
LDAKPVATNVALSIFLPWGNHFFARIVPATRATSGCGVYCQVRLTLGVNSGNLIIQ